MTEDVIKDLKISRGFHMLSYVKAVAREIGLSRALRILEECITEMVLDWCRRNQGKLVPRGPILEYAFNIYYLDHLGLDPKDVEIVEKTENRIVCRWRNFCEILDACKMLGLDTRIICKEAYENPAKVLLERINPRLNFRRNYDRIRPYVDFCEEVIEIL